MILIQWVARKMKDPPWYWFIVSRGSPVCLTESVRDRVLMEPIHAIRPSLQLRMTPWAVFTGIANKIILTSHSTMHNELPIAIFVGGKTPNLDATKSHRKSSIITLCLQGATFHTFAMLWFVFKQSFPPFSDWPRVMACWARQTPPIRKQTKPHQPVSWTWRREKGKCSFWYNLYRFVNPLKINAL